MPRSRRQVRHPQPRRPRTRSREVNEPRRRTGVIALMVAVVVLLGMAVAYRAIVRNSLMASSTVDASGSTGGPLFGASASDAAAVAKATSQFGHMPIIRVYYNGLPDPHVWTTGAPGVNKSAAIISFQAPPSIVLSGADDAALRQFFDTAPTSHTTYYSYYHEPELDVRAHDFTLASYKAAWAHIVAIADAAHNPSLKSTLILMAWDLNPRSGINWKDYLPAGHVVSTLGWDAYPAGTVADHDPQLTPPADFMGPAIAASKGAGLPFGFAEFGLATSNGRPAWLTEVGNYLATSGALFGTLFDSPRHLNTFITDSPSMASWRAVVRRSGLDTPATAPKNAATPASAALRLTGLTTTPASFSGTGRGRVTIAFALTQSADITVCVLNSHGVLVHQLSSPNRAAGKVRIGYRGYAKAGQRLHPGRYHILIVASNAHGSATAEATVTVASG
jgi:FlgD Ig-like domain